MHNKGVVLASASTVDFEITRHLYKTTDISAARNLGRVLAQRCIEAGITRVYWEPKYGDRTKLRVSLGLYFFNIKVHTEFPVSYTHLTLPTKLEV